MQIRVRALTTCYQPPTRVLYRAMLIGFMCFTLLPKTRGAEAAPVSIIVPKTADPVLAFAGHDLKRYLEQLTGDTVTTGDSGAQHRIFVGEIPPNLAAAEASRLRDEVARLQEDGFLIRAIRGDVVILGQGSRGSLYGCYAFLEQQGVRWFFPGKQYEIVPRHPLDWKSLSNESESPAFPKRILFYWPNNYSPVVDWIDFCAKVRLNRLAFHYTWPARDWYLLLQSKLLPELRKRGMEIEVGGHFLSSFMPRTLFPEHPDWFRMNDQGHRVNDFNLNPFNPEALDYLATGAVDYLRQMPEAGLFHLWADDIEGGGWSREPGKEDYTPSDQSLLVANYLVKKLRSKLPTADLAYLAYHDTVFPPRVVRPQAGLIYFYAPRERCYAHALNDPACDLNRQYSQALENGLPPFGAANAEVFEYYADQILYENMTNPPLPDVLSADMQYYHKLGIPAVGALMTNTSNFVTPMVNMFLYPQALWDPHRDLNRSLQDYGQLFFGDPELAGYFRDLSRGLESALKLCRYTHPGDAWDNIRPSQEPDEALQFHVRGFEDAIAGPLARAASTLDQCARRAKDKQFIERLQNERVSMNFTLRQVKLYYHLLKGEWLYRVWKAQHDQDAGLDALAELALARHTREAQKKFVAASGMKASPLIPDPHPLQAREAELTKAITQDPAGTAGVNIFGFGIDGLDEHLLNGVTGFVLSGPKGSKAVLWTDVATRRAALRPGVPGVEWLDELGRPLKSGTLDLYAAPVVAAAKGMPADQLFKSLLKGQTDLN